MLILNFRANSNLERMARDGLEKDVWGETRTQPIVVVATQ
jgi:hypothetical protein